jgi:hypothetical protein
MISIHDVKLPADEDDDEAALVAAILGYAETVMLSHLPELARTIEQHRHSLSKPSWKTICERFQARWGDGVPATMSKEEIAVMQRVMSRLFQAQQGDDGQAVVRPEQAGVWRSSNTNCLNRINGGCDLLADGGSWDDQFSTVWTSKKAHAAVRQRQKERPWEAVLNQDAPPVETPTPHKSVEVYVEPMLHTLLCGTLDAESPLCILKGREELLQHVMDYALPAISTLAGHLETDRVGAASMGAVTFPPPSGININMMPIILGSHASLPDELLRRYSSAVRSTATR